MDNKIKINGILVKRIPPSKRTDNNDYEVYISAGSFDTKRYKVIAKIANRVFGAVQPNSPIKVDFSFNEAFASDKSDKTIVVLRIVVQVYDIETDTVVCSKKQDYQLNEKTREYIPQHGQPASAVDGSIQGYWHKDKRVANVEGPFAEMDCKTIVEEVKLGTKYYFKAYPNTRIHPPEVLAVKWRYRYDDGELTAFNAAVESVVDNNNVMACIFHKQPSKIQVFAFFKEPSEKASVQFNVLGAQLRQPDPVVETAAQDADKSGCFCNRELTLAEFQSILEKLRDSEPKVKRDSGYKLFGASNCKLDDKTAKGLFGNLNKVFAKYGINSCLRKIHFIAQVYHETDRFRTTLEYQTDKNYKPYYGRGLMQLTWESNYRIYGSYIKKDLVKDYAQVAENLVMSCDSAGWYWKQGKVLGVGKSWKGPAAKDTPKFLKGVKIDYPKKTISWKDGNKTNKYGTVDLSLIADDDKVDVISYLVNGGGNGRTSRQDYVKTLKSIFGFPQQCSAKGNAAKAESKAIVPTPTRHAQPAEGDATTTAGDGKWHEPVDNPRCTVYMQSGGGGKGTAGEHWGLFGKTRNGSVHQGLDLFAKPGSNVYSCVKAEVYETKWHNGYGKTLTLKVLDKEAFYNHRRDYRLIHAGKGEIIQGANFDKAQDIFLFYGHLQELKVVKKDTNGKPTIVEAGQIVATSGVSGVVKGTCAPHLHFEIFTTKYAVGMGLNYRCNPGFYVHYKNTGEQTEAELNEQQLTARKGRITNMYGG